MKGQFESVETFTAYATISAGYYMVNQINKELEKPTNLINDAIDRATGYNTTENYKKELAIILKDIITAKKIIDADFSADEKFLLMLKNNTI